MATKKTKKHKRGSIASAEFNVIKPLLLASLMGISAFAGVSLVVNRNKALWKPSKWVLCTRPSLNQIAVLRCVECQAAKACPVKAIFRIDNNDPNFVEPNFCHGCGDCITKCVGKAIKLKSNWFSINRIQFHFLNASKASFACLTKWSCEEKTCLTMPSLSIT